MHMTSPTPLKLTIISLDPSYAVTVTVFKIYNK